MQTTRKQAYSPVSQGDPATLKTRLSSFVDLHHNEARLAGYLGCECIADCRRFICSFYVANPYLQVHDLKAPWAKEVLLVFTSDLEESLPIDLKTKECRRRRFPVVGVESDQAKQNKRILWAYAVKDIVDSVAELELNGHPSNCVQMQKDMAASFKTTLDRTIPQLSISTIKWPKYMGARPVFGESALERYNRADQALRLLKYSGVKHLWSTRYISEKLNTVIKVRQDDVPDWMQQGRNGNVED